LEAVVQELALVLALEPEQEDLTSIQCYRAWVDSKVFKT
jgi:hypothetical protein